MNSPRSCNASAIAKAANAAGRDRSAADGTWRAQAEQVSRQNAVSANYDGMAARDEDIGLGIGKQRYRETRCGELAGHLASLVAGAALQYDQLLNLLAIGLEHFQDGPREATGQ